MIFEVIVSTRNESGEAHLAPMGLHEQGSFVLLKPFHPSTTLDNILQTQSAVINFCDDVQVFAGCLTGHHQWPLTPVPAGYRLTDCLGHWELHLHHVHHDTTRPTLYFEKTATGDHGPFRGFNRGQFAVIEAAVLTSRLHLLPYEDIRQEMAKLQIILDKTAGPREHQAWQWLMDKVEKFGQRP